MKNSIKEMSPAKFREHKTRLILEQQIDETIKHITKSIITHSSSKLISRCNELRDALEELFDSYENDMVNNGNRMSTNTLSKVKNDFIRKTHSVRRLVK